MIDVSLPIELFLNVVLPDGMGSVLAPMNPSQMVGPPQTGKSFLVSYISVFARVPQGQRVHCMINGGFGGHWFALFPQGTFSGFDVFVCSQVASFVIGPGGLDVGFGVTRSSAEGSGSVEVHLTGRFG